MTVPRILPDELDLRLRDEGRSVQSAESNRKDRTDVESQDGRGSSSRRPKLDSLNPVSRQSVSDFVLFVLGNERRQNEKMRK